MSTERNLRPSAAVGPGLRLGVLRGRLERLGPRTVDALVALTMLVELELEAWLDTSVPGENRLPAAIAAVFLVAPVLIRRRWPAAALVAVAAVIGVCQTPITDNPFNGITGTLLPMLLVAFTAGARAELRRGLVALTLASALVGGAAIGSTFSSPSTGSSLAQELIGPIAIIFSFWGLGRIWRDRTRRAARFGELVSHVEQERQERERAAAVHERVRIGRELQDIIAQNVSAIIIQAGGARQLIENDPPRAREAILAVENAGREALADLRRTLGLLRTEDDPRELAPRPGLDQLDALLDSIRAQGPVCTLRIDGDPGELATGIDLLGYRVIEAALLAANVDANSRADVTIGYDRDHITIEIASTVPADALHDRLRGATQRVALYDGSLRVRPVAGGGFALRAQLPLAVR